MGKTIKILLFILFLTSLLLLFSYYKKEKEQVREISHNTKTHMKKAIFHTNKGDIEIIFNETTPKTTENFLTLAKEGFYDGTKFHRVIKDFMIQGGDPLTKDDELKNRWGTGGPGYTFEDEIGSENHNLRGTIAMANAGPNTNGSQFFINLVDNTYLDEKHTVFGKVNSGMDIVDAIGKEETDTYDRPINPIIIESVEIKE